MFNQGMYLRYKVKYSKTSLDRPTIAPSLNGPFSEVVGLGLQNIISMILHQLSFGTEIRRSIQGSGRSVEVVGQGGFTGCTITSAHLLSGIFVVNAHVHKVQCYPYAIYYNQRSVSFQHAILHPEGSTRNSGEIIMYTWSITGC